MLQKTAARISQWYFNKGYIQEEDIDSIRFGLEVVLSHFISFSLILGTGILSGNFWISFVFVLALALFRSIYDGYHAETFFRCTMMTLSNYFISVYLVSVLNQSYYSAYIINLCLINMIVSIFIYNIKADHQRKRLLLGVSMLSSILVLIVAMFKSNLFLVQFTSILLIINLSNLLPEKGQLE